MKIKILITSANLIPLRGGAERSLFALTEKLAKEQARLNLEIANIIKKSSKASRKNNNNK